MPPFPFPSIDANEANVIAALVRLRLRALLRAVGDHAPTLFILFPLVFGVGLLLLTRVMGDVGERMGGPDRWRAGAWVLAVLAALVLVRRGERRHATDLVACLPLTPLARWVDGYLSAMLRLLPLAAVLAAIVVATDGSGRHVLGVLGFTLLMPTVWGGNATGNVAPWSVPTWWVGKVTQWVPQPYRALTRRDLLLVVRNGAPGSGIYLTLAAVAMIGLMMNAVGEGAFRPALVALSLSAWGVSAMVSALLARQWRQLWMEVDAGVRPTVIWRSKVIAAALLGLLPGLVGAVVWAPVSLLEAVQFPLVGLGAGLMVGAAIMEGDGNPALHGVVALLLAAAVGVAAMLNPLLLFGLPFIAGYLERLGVPRLARRLDEVAESA